MRSVHPARVLLAVLCVVVSVLGLVSVASVNSAAGQSAGQVALVRAGRASALAAATATARATHRRVTVPALTTATSSTVASPSGSFTTTYAQTPQRVRRAGRWVPIDTRLHRTGTAFRAGATVYPLAVSGGGSAPFVTVGSGDSSVAMSWGAGPLPAPSVDGSTATYRISPTVSLRVAATPTGFSADVILTAAPTGPLVLRYPMALTGLSAAGSETGLVSFRDAAGILKDVIDAPLMWDAQRDENGDPANTADVPGALVPTTSGAELDLSPSMAFLTAPSTQYPVVIDPEFHAALRDTAMVKGSGSTGNTNSLNDNYYLRVGSVDATSTVFRSFVDFQVDRFNSYQIDNAELDLFQYGAHSCSAQPTSIQPVKSPGFIQDGSNATLWSNKPDPDTSSEWAIQPSFNTGGVNGIGGADCGQPDEFVPIDVTRMVDGFAAGSLDHYGFELSGPWGGSEAGAQYYKVFCSDITAPSGTGHCESTDDAPQLDVTFTPEMGLQSSYALITHRLNDRSNLYADAYDGNLVVAADDLKIRGRGLDLTVSRYYNSLSTASGAFGPGWTTSVGPDVVLRRRDSGGTPGAWFDYQAPSGTVYGTFVQDGSGNEYHKVRSGIRADLSYDSSSGNYKLTFHQSRMVYWFAGCSTCDQHMVKETDRHNNEIDYNYDSDGVLATIADTEGRTIHVCRNIDGTLSSIRQSDACDVAEPTGRTWQYGYTDAMLTSYIDPAGNETDYSYTSGELTRIEDPPGSDPNADRPTTDIGYTGGEVATISYAKDTLAGGADGGSYDFAFSYGASGDATLSVHCDAGDSDNNSTEVLDPNGHTTTYCFQNGYLHANNTREDQHRQIFDGLEDKQSLSYNPDMAVDDYTDPNGQSTGATTSLQYTSNLTENLTKVVAPADSGHTGGTTQLVYGDSSNPYQPTSLQDSSGRCTSYAYSSAGDLTDSYTGLTGSNCSGNTGGNHNHIDYNSDGTINYTYAPNGGATNAKETVYTYYSSGTSNGQLKWVGQPGGTRPGTGATCSATTSLCTGFTYDDSNRVASVTDGNNHTTTLHYDNLDRLIEMDLGGASSCNGGHTNCYSYTYDAEGNITQIIDAANRTRTVGYDRLNRQTSISVPGTARTITDAYDGVGNLISYTDGADSVGYGYDAANHLHTITDATGTFNVLTDANGRRTNISLPTTPGPVTIHTSYYNSGQVAAIWTHNGSSLPGQYTYTYTSGSNERDQLQKLSIFGVANDTYYGYDANARLCWVGTGSFSTCGASTNRSYGFGYDKDGDRTSVTATNTNYYGYRLNGQLCYSGATSGTTVATNCPTTPAGDTSYVNDGAGNLTGTSTSPNLIGYNSDNQATSLAPLGGGSSDTADYLDHGNQLRYSVATSSQTDTFDNGPLGVTAVTSTTSTGSSTTYYTRDPDGNLIDERTTTGSATTTYYYLTDRQNSVIALIDSTGTDAGDYQYTPYGRVKNTLTSVATANPWRYTSGYQDTQADGYYHLGARYYDVANSATFTQPDSVTGSIANPHTVDLYAYVGGDPINSSDPTGRVSTSVEVGAGVALGATAIGAGVFFLGAAAGIFTFLGIESSADVLTAVGTGIAGVGSALGGAIAGIGSALESIF